jgi:hypothetical protein
MGSRCKDVQELSRVESNSLEFHRKSCLSWLLLVGGEESGSFNGWFPDGFGLV